MGSYFVLAPWFPTLKREKMAIDAAFGNVAADSFLDDSEDEFTAPNLEINWDDCESTASNDCLDGLDTGGTSDNETFCSRLKAVGDRVVIADSLYSGIDSSRFAVSFSSNIGCALFF